MFLQYFNRFKHAGVIVFRYEYGQRLGAAYNVRVNVKRKKASRVGKRVVIRVNPGSYKEGGYPLTASKTYTR